jgi:hypothetical protein
MKIARQLAEGVGAWLHYQLRCGHLWLFSERFLTAPVAAILDSEQKGRVFAEFDHPVLAPLMIGAGKRPKVDFAVVNPADYPKVICAVETKWIGNPLPSISDLLWDLIRLELLAHHSGCTALFLLAGKRRDLEKLFTSNAFLCPSEKRGVRPLLKIDTRRSVAIRLDNPPGDRLGIVRELVRKYRETRMPVRLLCGRPYVYPQQCNIDHFQVYVWQIMTTANRPSFLPSEHKLYR